MNGNSTPAATVVHNGTVDRVGQTAWIAPGQGCKTKEGGEGREREREGGEGRGREVRKGEGRGGEGRLEYFSR